MLTFKFCLVFYAAKELIVEQRKHKAGVVNEKLSLWQWYYVSALKVCFEILDDAQQA